MTSPASAALANLASIGKLKAEAGDNEHKHKLLNLRRRMARILWSKNLRRGGVCIYKFHFPGGTV